MSYTGLKIVSVFDPATGTVVQMNNVSPEGKFEKGAMVQQNTQGSDLYCGDDAVFEFTSYDDAGLTQLETWMKARTPLQAVTYGIDAHILWYESVPITVKRNLGFKVGGRNGFTVTMAKKGGSLNIKSAVNLLYMVLGWTGDSTSVSNYIYGQTGGTKSFNGTSMSFADATQIQMIGRFAYPISGIILRLEGNHSTTNSPCALKAINSLNQEIGTVTANRRAELTTPSNTYDIKAHIFEMAVSTGTTISTTNPSVSTTTGADARKDVNGYTDIRY